MGADDAHINLVVRHLLMAPHHFLTVIFLSLLLGCTNTPNKFPNLNEATTTSIILVGKFKSGKYLQQFDDCGSSVGNLEVICMDPPPLLLKYEVVDTLYGEKLNHRTIFVATTDHFGLESYDFDGENIFLVHLITDNTSYTMPRYHKHELAITEQGSLVAPVWREGDVWFMPCSIRDLTSEVKFKPPPKGVYSLLENFNDWDNQSKSYKNVAQEKPQLYSIYDEYVQPKKGYSIEAIKNNLSKTKPISSEFGCKL